MRRPKRHKSKRDLIREHRRLKETLGFMESRYQQAMEDIVAALSKIGKLSDELKRKNRDYDTVGKIIERAAAIDFRRCQSGYYAIEVKFNGDFMGGISRHGELQEYVARKVASEIESQIRSSKFIETATARERREYQTRVRRAYQGGEWSNDDEAT